MMTTTAPLVPKGCLACLLLLCTIALLFPSSLSWISSSKNRPFRQQHPRHFSAVPTSSIDTSQSSSSSSFTPFDLNLLLLDHYDSYTYNLYDQIAQLCQKPPLVLPKDVATDWNELKTILRETYNTTNLDGVILSPGPGRPRITDLGADIIRCSPKLPILGVCLGHQLLALTYCSNNDEKEETDGVVICAPHGPVHGHVHDIHHDGSSSCPIFQGLPSPFPATRYHSLVVQLPSTTSTPALPPTPQQQQQQNTRKSSLLPILQTTAVCYDPSSHQPVIMGLAHCTNPHFGVQFHPESIGTQPHGQLITQNFVTICQDYHNNQKKKQQTRWRQTTHWRSVLSNFGKRHNGVVASISDHPIAISTAVSSTQSKFGEERQVYVYKVPNLTPHVSPQQAFEALMSNEPYAIWLDGANHHQPTQCSILTCYHPDNNNNGGGGHRVEYYGKEHDETIRGLYVYRPNHGMAGSNVNGNSVLKTKHVNGRNRKQINNKEICERFDNDDILSFLKREHSRVSNHVHLLIALSGDDKETGGVQADHVVIQKVTEEDAKQLLPFDFRGGHVGYLGYEVRHDMERRIRSFTGAETNDHLHQYGIENTVISSSSNGYHKESHSMDHNQPTIQAVPTAAFLFAHQSMVHDPNTQDWYLVGVHDPSSSTITTREKLFQWFRNTEISLRRLADTSCQDTPSRDIPTKTAKSFLKPSSLNTLFGSRYSKESYQRKIADCHEFIRLGESYELCLTNQLVATVPQRVYNDAHHHQQQHRRSCWELYQKLRQRNPAPFSAFLNWNSQQCQTSSTTTADMMNGDTRRQQPPPQVASLAICCSSPERFVSVKRLEAHDEAIFSRPRFVVEAKPIKGTCSRVLPPVNGDTEPTTNTATSSLWCRQQQKQLEDTQRALDLQSSIKNRAENLMIVDLLRNDLSRVCRTGSVHVPKLMQVESYSTVHQMVSTIRGELDQPSNCNGKSAIDVLEACFPGGSMTGAPKLRTLELLDQLEEGMTRGPYSGCLGYISLNGSLDMNIIIRTAVVTPSADGNDWNISVGAGGAITAMSDCDDEYDEMILKAQAVMDAVQDWVCHVDHSSAKTVVMPTTSAARSTK